jgi:hypothetical protein
MFGAYAKGRKMMKEQEVKNILKNLKVGESTYFSTSKDEHKIEVERVFKGLDEGWMVIYQGERKVFSDLDEAARFLSQHWEVNIKKRMQNQYQEMNDLIDLGEY